MKPSSLNNSKELLINYSDDEIAQVNENSRNDKINQIPENLKVSKLVSDNTDTASNSSFHKNINANGLEIEATNLIHEGIYDENASLLESVSHSSNNVANDNKINDNKCLYMVDVLLSVIIFSPIVCFYWYGTWLYLDTYFIPSDYKLSNFVSWGIGLVILLPGYLSQSYLQTLYEYFKSLNRTGTVLRFWMRCIYIYIMCFAVLLQWRGLWNLLAVYFFQDMISQLALAIIATSYFCLSRSTKSLVATPFLLFIDDFENFFQSKSKIKISTENQCYQYTIDFCVTEIIECFALVVIWRGFDTLGDYFIFPDDQFYSIIACLVISHLIYLLVAISQNFVFKYAAGHGLLYRLFIEDFVHILMFFASVLAWKFYWNSIDFYIITNENQLMVYLIFHFASFIAVIVLRTSAILVGPGVSFLDGELDNEIKAYFEINYLSSFFKSHVHEDYNRLPNSNSIYYNEDETEDNNIV